MFRWYNLDIINNFIFILNDLKGEKMPNIYEHLLEIKGDIKIFQSMNKELTFLFMYT